MSAVINSVNRFRCFSLPGLVLGIFVLAMVSACGSKGETKPVPDNFNSLSTEDKMDYLMERMSPDSLGRFVCDVALGKIYNSRIEFQQARLYAYEKYDQKQIAEFESACQEYEAKLPLHEKVKFFKISSTEDPDKFSYDLGLRYVGDIRENSKNAAQVSSELEKLRRECEADPEFYRRFMKGFKIALEIDHNHDLDENIYTQFITYTDSLQ